jgi:predicted nuclease of predicted toxin-antitoxin system
MAYFKFLLDRGIKHLAHCFPAKRVVTTEDLGLPEATPDEEIIDEASRNGHLLIAAKCQ